MDIQEKEWGSFAEHLKTKGVVKIGRNALGVITNLVREGSCSLDYNDIELMWETWQDAKAQAVPEGFVLVKDKPVAYMVQNKFWNGEFEVKLSSEMPEPEFDGDSYDIEIPLYAIEAQEPAND